MITKAGRSGRGHPEMGALSSFPNLFLIGMPRSGTKLLREILNNHSKIFIPDFELVVIPKLVSEYGDRALTPEDRTRIVKTLRRSIFFFYYESGRSFDFSQLHDARTLQQLINALFLELAGSKETLSYYGDKSPSNIAHCDMLMNFFPNARFIHIVRDPRDYALSVRKAWNKSIVRAVDRWSRSIESFSRIADSAPERVLEVRYEDLLVSPASTARLCTDFLGLEFDSGVIQLTRAVENLGDARSLSIESENCAKYLKAMDSGLIARLEEATVEQLRRYNYPFRSPRGHNQPAHPMTLRLLRITDAFSLLRFNVKAHGLVGSVKKILAALKAQL